MKENIEIQATSFERIRPYRMNEAGENGEVSAAIESMGKLDQQLFLCEALFAASCTTPGI